MGRHALAPDPQAVRQALANCDLTDLGSRVYAHLSLGQQQRVLLARALAQSAGAGRLMLLDEPASAMDLWHIHNTMRQLRHLTRAGLAVLVVLHDLNLAARYADTVWLLDRGRLAASGPWDRVLTPAVLEPVYRVTLAPVAGLSHHRPMFDVDLPGTLNRQDGAPAT
jgi:iron complex transport system ATP-binding protein